MSRLRLARVFWIGAAAILVAAALVALAAVLRGDFSDNDGRILVTLGALLYTGGAALAGLALVERGPARVVGAGGRRVRAGLPGAATSEVRVLGTLDGVELVATRNHVDGVAVETPARGERLVLRRRA